MEEEIERFVGFASQSIANSIMDALDSKTNKNFKLLAQIDVNEGNVVQTKWIDIPGKNNYSQKEAEEYATCLNKEYQTFMKTGSINLIEPRLRLEMQCNAIINQQ